MADSKFYSVIKLYLSKKNYIFYIELVKYFRRNLTFLVYINYCLIDFQTVIFQKIFLNYVIPLFNKIQSILDSGYHCELYYQKIFKNEWVFFEFSEIKF